MGIDHHHGHSHDHGHHGHSHNHKVTSKNEGRMAIAALLTGAFMFAEVIGGLISGSLALLADAGHMLTDFAALSLAWLAFRMARRPADWRRTFGFDRFAVLIAFVNGLALFLIAAMIVIEAVKRWGHPVEVMGTPMLIVAALGFAVNIIVFLVLRGADTHNLNVRGAALHVLGDLLGSAAAIAAALIIIFTGWMPADLIMSVLVSLIILRSAFMVVKDSAHILLEGAPANLDRREIKTDLLQSVTGLTRVEHIHIWSISQERPMMTLQAEIARGHDAFTAAKAIKARLHDAFEIEHVTVEVSQAADCTEDLKHGAA